MTKKILFAIFGMFTIFSVQSAQIVNVEYIHQLINQKWDITLNYSPELRSTKAAANMKYLLTAVDVANEILNGKATTDYGNGEFATTQAADTIATNTAIETLVKKTEKYSLELTNCLELYKDDGNPDSLLMISAAGTFYIDWGDGVEEIIEKTTVGEQYIDHDYASGGCYNMRLGGMATAYSDDVNVATVSMLYVDFAGLGIGSVAYSWLGAEIDGCLGCVFPTLSDGSQPRFISTFADAEFFDEPIPENLFDGIHGAPTENMFRDTFNYANIISIPENLFSGISGPPAAGMFANTFVDCDISSIPENLFSGISGPPAPYMFDGTFASNRFLTSIPENLFSGIDTSEPLADEAFMGTFGGCASLTGPSARINGKYLYEIWPDATSEQVGRMYHGATGLSDYDNIPDAWK